MLSQYLNRSSVKFGTLVEGGRGVRMGASLGHYGIILILCQCQAVEGYCEKLKLITSCVKHTCTRVVQCVGVFI